MISDGPIPKQKTLIQRLQEEELQTKQIIEFDLVEQAYIAKKGDKAFIKADMPYQAKGSNSIVGRFKRFDFQTGSIILNSASSENHPELAYSNLYVSHEAIKDYRVIPKERVQRPSKGY